MNTPQRPTTYATEAEIPADRRHYYRQAPEEFGGEWWPVTPFSPRTWERFAPAEPVVETLPEGFTDAFGPRPTREMYPDYHEHRLAKLEWEQELAEFKALGLPADMTGVDTAGIDAIYEASDLGRPVFYEHRAGFRAIFPEAAVKGYDANPWTVVNLPALVIANHQIRMLKAGMFPEEISDLVPPNLYTVSD